MYSRILITGGAGFIGSNLVDALLADGHAVRVLDNLSTGKRENLPLESVDASRLELIEGDIADGDCVRRALKGCSAVVHLAAVASVPASVADPLGTHQANLVGTLQLCEAMREQGVRRILFASTAAVYGPNGEGMPIVEDIAKQPLTPYAIDKLSSEGYLTFYQRHHGLEPLIFRFFNIYGPRQDPSSPYSGVISIFMQRLREGLPIQVYGDGEQTRDFVYVGDVVQLLLEGLRLETVGDAEIINLGLGERTTLNQLLALLSGIADRRPQVEYLPARPGDIRHSRADSSRLKARFAGKTDYCSMQEGLSRLWASLD